MTNDDHKAKQPRVWWIADCSLICDDYSEFFISFVDPATYDENEYLYPNWDATHTPWVPKEDYDALASQLAEANAKYDVAGASKLCEAYTIMAIESGRMHKQVQALRDVIDEIEHCAVCLPITKETEHTKMLGRIANIAGEALQVKPKTEGELCHT